jgi:hypothetical protein
MAEQRIPTVNTYYGVRVSQREADLLQLRDECRRRGYPIPEPLKWRAEWLHNACLRVAGLK